MSWEDDIHLGESLRGMQDSHVGNYSEIGAAKALSQLRGALGSLAQNRFGGHAPVSKQMRSPYKDSTQIGISTTGMFNQSSWLGSSLPTVSGFTRVYKSFKPTKAILTELVTVLFSNPSVGPNRTVAMNVSDASDLVLISAFSGADNCFPNAPTEANGISGPTFANNSLGNGISWPTINGGIDMTVAFAIEQSLLYAVQPPAGFATEDIVSITCKIRFNLLGPSLR
jgi:hypothetical protein